MIDSTRGVFGRGHLDYSNGSRARSHQKSRIRIVADEIEGKGIKRF